MLTSRCAWLQFVSFSTWAITLHKLCTRRCFAAISPFTGRSLCVHGDDTCTYRSRLYFGPRGNTFAVLCSTQWYIVKSRWSLLYGVYARGSKISHQSALECVTVVDSTSHSKKTPQEVRLCGWKSCPALIKEDEEASLCIHTHSHPPAHG